MPEETTGGIGAMADALKLSIPTVTVALNHLVRLGIAKEGESAEPASSDTHAT